MVFAVNKESGASFFSLMVALIVAGIFFTVGFRLFTPYKDHEAIKSILEQVVYDQEQVAQGSRAIRRSIQNRAVINQVREDIADDALLKIENKEGILHFDLFYEERVPMFYNVDAVVTFKEHYEVTVP